MPLTHPQTLRLRNSYSSPYFRAFLAHMYQKTHKDIRQQQCVWLQSNNNPNVKEESRKRKWGYLHNEILRSSEVNKHITHMRQYRWCLETHFRGNKASSSKIIQKCYHFCTARKKQSYHIHEKAISPSAARLSGRATVNMCMGDAGSTSSGIIQTRPSWTWGQADLPFVEYTPCTTVRGGLDNSTSGAGGNQGRASFGYYSSSSSDSRFTRVHSIAHNLMYLSNNRVPEIILKYILGFGGEENGDIESTVFHTQRIFSFYSILLPRRITGSFASSTRKIYICKSRY